MKFLKSLLMGTGAVVLAGSVLALLLPKAVHAIAATAVQVVNTSSNPVITGEASLQASQIVTIDCYLGGFSTNIRCLQIKPDGTSGLVGPNGGYVVPKNSYFVLKSIDNNIGPGAYSGSGPYYIGVPGGNGIIPGSNGIFEKIFLQPNAQVSFSSGIVVGPGQEVAPIYVQGFDPVGGADIYLHGYLTANE
jgi:hypothetical protein